jgi:branched-chain amino acid transport system substrate-binding protein
MSVPDNENGGIHMAQKKISGYLVALILILSFTLPLFTVGCGQPKSETDGSQGEVEVEPIRVGLIVPLTGPTAAAGIALRDGAEIARDEINAMGGINGRPIQIIVEDSVNDPATAASAANKLISRDNVVALEAAWGSSPTLAVEAVARDNEVPQIVETASSFKVTDRSEQGNPWTFRLNATSQMEAAAVKPSLVSDLGFKNVMFLSVNNDWGRGAILDYTPVIESTGGKVIGSEFFEQDETNFISLLTRANNSEADSLIVTTDAPQVALIAEQAYNLGMKKKVLVTGGSCFLDKVVALVGPEASEGLMASLFYAGAYDTSLSSDSQKAEYFNAEWKKRGHEWIEIPEAARAYDAIWTLAEAMKTLPEGQVTREGVREALAKVRYKGIIFGEISFGEWRNFINQNAAPVAVAAVKDGKPVIVMQPSTPKP